MEGFSSIKAYSQHIQNTIQALYWAKYNCSLGLKKDRMNCVV